MTYARYELGLAKSTVGALLLLRALCTAAGCVFLGRTTFWHFRPRPVVAGLGLLALFVHNHVLSSAALRAGS